MRLTSLNCRSDTASLEVRVIGNPLTVGLPISCRCSLFRHLFNSRAEDNRLIVTALAFAFVFASVHFVLHDLEQSRGDLIVQDDCQVCRVTHVPVVSTPGLSLFVALRVITYVLPTKTVRRHNTLRFPTLGARAPPQS